MRDAILQGLLTVVQWTDRLDDTAPFKQELPLADTSLRPRRSACRRGLRSQLYEPVAAYFAADTTPTSTANWSRPFATNSRIWLRR